MYHLIFNSFRRHHWSRASILSTSLLVTAQHSEPYRKIGRMHVLYNFSLIGMVILDLQICLSRFCIAARVMALWREISGELWHWWVDQGAKVDKLFNHCNLLAQNSHWWASKARTNKEFLFKYPYNSCLLTLHLGDNNGRLNILMWF